MILVIISIILTVGLFIGLGISVDTSGYDPKISFKLRGRQALALCGLLVMLFGCVTTIPANHVGIVYSPFGGTKQETLKEGFAFKSPFDKVYKISTETQTKKIKELTTQTMDAQYLTTKLAVKYKVNEANAFLVFKQYRTLDNMSSSLIKDATQRVLESITTKYNVIDILGEKRNDIYSELKAELSKELAIYGVEFDSVTINDMDAGEKLESAIEDEAVAKKEAETAEQKKIKAEKDAETKLIKAKAERDANALLEKSLTDKILQQQWIEKWNGKMPTYYGGDANLMIGVGESK
jgi:regulator of protease activity HflC (stomatin/prohibitin superfamily)